MVDSMVQPVVPEPSNNKMYSALGYNTERSALGARPFILYFPIDERL